MDNSTIFFTFFTIFCLVFLPTPTSASSNRIDLLSLLAFKSSLKDPQGALSSWNHTLHFCSWNGIRCGRRNPDRVVEINLMSRGLMGPLSPHVGNLSFLKTIILQNNTFHGLIPIELSLLRRLKNIEFSNNSFSGPIPANLSECPNLVYINLIDNKLSGNIPIELGSMSKLQVLYLSNNNLSGNIPPSIGNMTSLSRLSLLSCELIGQIPESVAQLMNLFFLQLGTNHLTGTIPSALFNISAIDTFSVSENELHGVIPSTIGLTLPKLRRLYLFRNHFTGPLPLSISNASWLEDIELFENYFTGPMPILGRFPCLKYFILGANLIEDDINFISSLTNSTELENLEIGENPLSGSLPESIANLSTRLSILSIDGTKVHGNIPLGIGNLVGLTVLSLTRNYLDGSIPMSIQKLSEMRELSFYANKFTNEIPSSIGNLTFLINMYLRENQFLGKLPSSIGNCTNLLDLDVSHNNFHGLIPQEIMSISSLSITLGLSHNNFEGSIPYEVGSLTNIGALDLSNNKLSGLIPNSLSDCVSLQQLHLEGNSLEGEIPSELSALMGLQYLDLSKNNLSGSIPRFLGNLKLEYLNLSFNKLGGEVPTIGVFKNTTSVSVDGNNELCGGILELKLPPCSPLKSQRTNLSTLLKILIPILAVGGICLVLLALFIYKRKKSRKNVSPSTSPFIGTQFIRLSYADLFKATGGFADTNLLGIGGFGSVYKGILNDGQTQVAVKVINLSVRGASKSFMAECNALRDIRHRNLLKVLSVCESIDFQGNDFKSLIYEFKVKGSLEKWLYPNRDEEGKQNAETNTLSMVQRLNIAIDTAQAIEYLHFGTDSSIIHGDLKPSNILLDHDMTACVGDFGLAKIVSDIIPSHESSSIGIKGTIGYIPPEYGTSHSVSIQGDVYSFGIVLLEMFTNKRPTNNLFEDHINLHSFVAAALPDRVTEIVDPQFLTGLEMQNDKVKDCMISILSIGVSCSKEMPRERMLMKDVVVELHKTQKKLCG